ncbi:HAD family hydrolase [Nocardioides sp. CF8]|uniref:HAD family hydrolase n=1 Tax=Nocardioides sp. CF8 TaxID=110319 RepID=UPI00032F6CE2|nr:HAD family hydrolase [Nocardioides sp. CF8]EON25713.1 HAD family hydrolase [Nocardioides sp. CF8]
MPAAPPVVITFDLFSALIDSRTGASSGFDALSQGRGWEVSGRAVYDNWDARNKEAQRTCTTWEPYAELAGRALGETYRALGIDGDPEQDLVRVLDTLPAWPLWPDVAHAMASLARTFRIGLLSNVDDSLFRRTAAAAYVDPDLAMTSERLGAYKPDPRIYLRATEALGAMVHVASSARDVRGSLEAGIPVVRLARSGHRVDPEGPAPSLEAHRMEDLAPLVAEAAQAHAAQRLGD